MDTRARDQYLETQIMTATPQRLRLMLIEGAIRKARAAQAAGEAGNVNEGLNAVGHCRDIVTELIAGIQPERSPLAREVLGIYMFLFSTLVEAQVARDLKRMTDVIRVLEEERQTWQAVCEQMPERPVADAALPAVEEVAPERVSEAWSPGYAATPNSRSKSALAAFSIEA